MNLKYIKVSLFEVTRKNKLFHHILIFLDVPVYDEGQNALTLKKHPAFEEEAIWFY